MNMSMLVPFGILTLSAAPTLYVNRMKIRPTVLNNHSGFQYPLQMSLQWDTLVLLVSCLAHFFYLAIKMFFSCMLTVL